MKRRRTFDLVSYLQRLHLLPERLTRKTEAEDLLKQLYDHEKSTGKAPDRLTSRDLHLSPEQLEALQRELDFIISAGLRDTEQGYYVQGEAVRPRRDDLGPDEAPFNSQQALYKYYEAKKNKENNG